jgi:hypothetical protein
MLVPVEIVVRMAGHVLSLQHFCDAPNFASYVFDAMRKLLVGASVNPNDGLS